MCRSGCTRTSGRPRTSSVSWDASQQAHAARSAPTYRQQERRRDSTAASCTARIWGKLVCVHDRLSLSLRLPSPALFASHYFCVRLSLTCESPWQAQSDCLACVCTHTHTVFSPLSLTHTYSCLISFGFCTPTQTFLARIHSRVFLGVLFFTLSRSRPCSFSQSNLKTLTLRTPFLILYSVFFLV